MKKFFLVYFCLFFIGISCAEKVSANEILIELPVEKNLSSIIDNFLPTVVTINAIGNKFDNDFQDEPISKSLSLGSGFIISEDGFIITNNHVIDGAESINVKLKGSDTNFPAKVMGSDEIMDIALLKINIKTQLPFVEFDTGDDKKIGDTVIIAGNPYNLGVSVSTGIISALNRNLQLTSFDNFIQTDALINKGNSGGPMFNMNGKVIGLTSAIYSPEGANVGIGFAVPASDLLPIINELKEYGRVRRGWIGITTENAQREIFDILGSQLRRGVIITNVLEESSASEAGLLVSDIIISYNDRKISNARDLSLLISSTEIDSLVDILIFRNGKMIQKKVKVEESKDIYKYDQDYEEAIANAVEIFDMVLVPINKSSKKKFKIEESKGLYVIKTKKNGLADRHGIKVGNIVLSINQDAAETGSVIVNKVHSARVNKIPYVFLIVKNENKKNKLIFMPVKEYKVLDSANVNF